MMISKPSPGRSHRNTTFWWLPVTLVTRFTDLWSGFGLRASAPTEKPILYVPGNHDAWDCEWPHDLAAARGIAVNLGIHLLAEGEAFDIGAVRFCGATLWTNFRLRPGEEATTCANHDEGSCHDNRRIKVSERDPRRWLARDAMNGR